MGRLATLTIAFIVALAGITGVAIHRLGTPARNVMLEPNRPLAMFELALRHVAFLRESDPIPRPLVLWLGDSTIDPFVQDAYPEIIGRRNRGRYSQKAVAIFGLDLFHYYPLLGAALPLEPQLVVLIANPRLFDADRDPQRFQLMSSLIPLAELPRAALLPLAARGLTVPRLLLNRTLESPNVRDGYATVEGIRVLFREASFWEPLGKPTRWGRALAEARTLEQYARPISPRAPVVRMLEASVDLARRHGARVLVIVSPIPYERMAAADLYEPEAYDRKIAILRHATRRAGGQLLDLHRTLAEDEFRDFFGHYTEAGAQHLARIVEPHVLRLARVPAARVPSPAGRRAR